DLARRARTDRAAALVAALLAGAGVQHAEVIVDLGDRADRRPRVARRALLLDRDRRRQPADALVLRLLHLAEELPRVRRQRLDVAALAPRVQRVARQRGGPSAYSGSNASEDLPEPDGPVITTRRCFGSSRWSTTRLCSRAPSMT